ncbi:MAG: translation initiation factor IF-3 [Anaerolineae bacterium]|nr:translation initiation factor IF-3 [Anaerolineae bacterium]
MAISAGDYRINERIRAREVRLITDGNENLGVVSLQQALELATERGLDLVEVAPTADPPVCKIMDFGKFQYERAKKEREARKQQKQIEVKEIRLRPKTDDHHRQFKVRDARRWLTEGMKVKVRIRFRGREITYPEIAREMLDEVAEDLKDIAVVEQEPNMEGRTMLMVLAPATDKKK